jgi:hypothetical protein
MIRHKPIEKVAAELAERRAHQPLFGVVRPGAGYVERPEDLSGADAGLEILTLANRSRHMLGWTPQHQDLPVPCWSCGLKTIRRWDGGAGLEDRAECSNPDCRETYEDERFTLLIGEAEKGVRAKQARAAAS